MSEFEIRVHKVVQTHISIAHPCNGATAYFLEQDSEGASDPRSTWNGEMIEFCPGCGKKVPALDYKTREELTQKPDKVKEEYLSNAGFEIRGRDVLWEHHGHD